jgi:hypothetical protein
MKFSIFLYHSLACSLHIKMDMDVCVCVCVYMHTCVHTKILATCLVSASFNASAATQLHNVTYSSQPPTLVSQ